ncbi:MULTISPECIES: hypothetical protein [Mammaliicoccus]|uniref:DUF5673 domain-containing protein n=1 Tax=Mammaliicoccus sciuri TaxID=1296 RepID=A0AAW5LIA3_MAMSC|nr:MULTISPECIES: hypothetical protein [Mammaliicoccus]AQN32283.1 hypothetical protein [Staphylococcus phage phi879]MBG9209470.1 hypothetical protein [Mammaliicoccus sciuri]MCD5140459.1 hypothetical protein [Mammaliicoccus sciuri]MCQ9303034.1 hypothetical protein [Mammaliicoccus sciuri]PNY96193.1 hypothetical protein CD035_04280 [Mammaliicoccus sciuri]
MGILYKISLFISSFAPLYVMLIIQEIDSAFKYNSLSKLPLSIYIYWFILITLIIISVISIYIIFKDKGNKTIEIDTNLEKQGDNIISYIMTYLVPLLSIDPNDYVNLLQNAFLFTIIGTIYIQQNLLFLNPIFSLLNYKFYKDSNNEILLSKYSIEELKSLKCEGKKVFARKIDEKFWIIKNVRK